jgi:hypothetical protein
MSKNKGLMLAAGGIGIVGLAWYLSQSGGPTEGGNQGGGGGGGLGGFFMPGSGTPGVSAGIQEPNVIYNVSFPPSMLPEMPTFAPFDFAPVPNFDDGGGLPSLPADSSKIQPGAYQVAGKKVEVQAPFMGPVTTSPGAGSGSGGGAGFGGGGAGGRGGSAPAQPGEASGIPGGGSSKKGAAVGADTAPGGLPGLIGGLIGGIGGLFGW